MLTAVEDFVAARDGLRLVVVPAFFGFGVVWHRERPWSDAVARILDPFDRNPILERLEANRVEQLARRYSTLVELWAARDAIARQEAVLQRLLDSSAFSVAERLSRLRAAAGIATEQSVVSKDEIRGALRAPNGARCLLPPAIERPQRRRHPPRQAVGLLLQRALELEHPGVEHAALSENAIARAASRRASATSRAALPSLVVGRGGLVVGDDERSVPLLGHADVRLDPQLQIGDQLERAVVHDAQVGDQQLAPGRPDLKAEVDVEAVIEHQCLIEAQVAHDPRREHQQLSVERPRPRPAAARAGPRRSPAARRRRTPRSAGSPPSRDHRPLPPGDAADAGWRRRTRHADLGIGERVAGPWRRTSGSTISVCGCTQHQRLEVVVGRGGVEHQVVACVRSSSTDANAYISESGSAARSTPGWP